MDAMNRNLALMIIAAGLMASVTTGTDKAERSYRGIGTAPAQSPAQAPFTQKKCMMWEISG